MKHYLAMVSAANEKLLLEEFKSDLFKHDRQWCKTHPSQTEFLWCLRRTGTQLVTKINADHWEAHHKLAERDGRYQWYHWDGRSMAAISELYARDIALGWAVEQLFTV